MRIDGCANVDYGNEFKILVLEEIESKAEAIISGLVVFKESWEFGQLSTIRRHDLNT
jgi:hypothetical protein